MFCQYNVLVCDTEPEMSKLITVQVTQSIQMRLWNCNLVIYCHFILQLLLPSDCHELNCFIPLDLIKPHTVHSKKYPICFLAFPRGVKENKWGVFLKTQISTHLYGCTCVVYSLPEADVVALAVVSLFLAWLCCLNQFVYNENNSNCQHRSTISRKPVFEKIAKIQSYYAPLCGHTTFVLLTTGTYYDY